MGAPLEQPREDWASTLAAFDAGDSAAAFKVGAVISRLLAGQRCSRIAEAREDVHQETLLRFLRSVRQQRMHVPDACVGYLRTIARRALLDWLAERRVEPRHLEELQSSSRERAAAGAQDPGVRLDLERSLRALSERERLVIELLYLEGRSYEETCAVLDLPPGTLRTVRTRALKKLRGSMRNGSAAHAEARGTGAAQG